MKGKVIRLGILLEVMDDFEKDAKAKAYEQNATSLFSISKIRYEGLWNNLKIEIIRLNDVKGRASNGN